ncbi:autoinducer binding domain-containing protein [Amorphus sp. MBR-141]
MEFLNQALQVLDTLRRATSARDVAACVGGTLPGLGLSGFGLTTLHAVEGARPTGRSVLIERWPKGWSSLYQSRAYLATDPILAFAERRVDPFTWRDVRDAGEGGAAQTAFFEEAAGFGLTDGIAIPVRRLSAAPAVAVFAGAAEACTAPKAMALLQVVSTNAHARLTGAVVHAVPATAERGTLTRRERECLQWCAEGKTSWEISQILSISQHTADWYLASAGRKLGAANRLHAVAEALRRGLIS